MDTRSEILDLVSASGKDATAMTQTLKEIGGDMQSGLRKVGLFFYDEGFLAGTQEGRNIGRLEGTLSVTAVITLVGTGYLLWRQHNIKKRKKNHEEEKQQLAKAINNTTANIISTAQEPNLNVEQNNYNNEVTEDNV